MVFYCSRNGKKKFSIKYVFTSKNVIHNLLYINMKMWITSYSTGS